MLRELRTPAQNDSRKVSESQVSSDTELRPDAVTIILFTILWVRHSGAPPQVQLVPAPGAVIARD